jgi:glutamate/tyrosine decarboxylase-like PLP-dependent enzyme
MSDIQKSPIEISEDEFKKIGYQLIDTIAGFISSFDENQVTSTKSLEELQNLLSHAPLPEKGKPSGELISKASNLLLNNSLLNGHPKFMGFITSSPAQIGMLADLLASAVNPNVSAQILSPIATEIEKQTIKWLCEFIGVPTEYGGLLVSGGNMANFTAFLTARSVKMSKKYKEEGLTELSSKWVIYCSKKTHTWVEKATTLFGNGSNSIRWIPTDASNKMDNNLLENAIKKDLENGHHPFIVVGTAGDVSTGSVDNLHTIAAVCKNYNLWFHIDGAYGVPAAVLPELKSLFNGLELADSIALDPHKWLYSPLEAGCVLVKNPKHLLETFSSNPEYYNFNNNHDHDLAHNFYEYGLQNSRGFRALKVWLILQQAGRNGFIEMIRKDIELSVLLFELAKAHPELEASTQNLSIATFRYVPLNYDSKNPVSKAYLNSLNEKLLHKIQQGGKAFLSNAIVNEDYCLRACIVNFRTSKKDIHETIEIIVDEGREMHIKLHKI